MSSGKMVTYDQLMLPLMKALVNLGGSPAGWLVLWWINLTSRTEGF